jgi:hypothetical protein
LVRGSGIGGTNWDTKLEGPSGYVQFRQITCANQDIYAAGWADEGLGAIFRSSDHGVTWSTIFQSTDDVPQAITSDPAGNLYSAEIRFDSDPIDWLVRKAAPGGTNWTVLDMQSNYPPPQAIAVDAMGNVCVTAAYTWLTRQYSVATGQWSTTDLFSYSTNKNANPMGVAIAPDGSTFVVGFGTSDSGQQRWIVRKQAAPSPILQARALENVVNEIMDREAIGTAPASVLLAALGRIVVDIEKKDSSFLCKRLRTFSKKVQEYVKQGTLAQSDGQLLVNGTDNLRQVLGCQEEQ